MFKIYNLLIIMFIYSSGFVSSISYAESLPTAVFNFSESQQKVVWGMLIIPIIFNYQLHHL